MIDKFTVERYLLSKECEKLVEYDKSTGIIRYKSDGFETTVDAFLQALREKNHCDFEEIYYCHATLQSTLKCRQCGTIIFASDDCSEYDDNLVCPICGNYKTHFKYWTKEDIESDIIKQNSLLMMEAEMRDNERQWKYKKDNKHEIWEKWSLDYVRFNHRYDIKIINNKDRFLFMDLTAKEIAEKSGEKYKKPKFEKYIEIRFWDKENEDEWVWSSKRHDLYIPLNLYSIKVALIRIKARREYKIKNKGNNNTKEEN